MQTTMKEMVGGCCVCSDERGWPENPLVYCDGQNCTVAVHQACYGIVTVPTGPWYCRKCESQERSTRVRCELCPSRDGALKKTDNQGWAHVVCALYIPEVRFGNVTTMEPIILQLIPQERYGKNCYICQDMGKTSRATVGACMQCNKSNCKQQFHVTCAQSLGLLCEEAGNYLDNVKYCGYCQHHYSKLKKGGNVKTIPPYKPISRGTSSDSASSPEKEIDAAVNPNNSSSATSTVKVNTTSNTSTTKRKSYNTTKQPTIHSTNSNSGNASIAAATTSSHALNSSNSLINSNVNSLHTTTTSVSSLSSSSFGVNGAVSSGAGTTSTSNVKGNSLSNSNNSYKDSNRHSKNSNKISTSSNKDKDKDNQLNAVSSRDKSIKTTKNKDFSNVSNHSLSSNSSNNSSNSISSTPAGTSGGTSVMNPHESTTSVQNPSSTNSTNMSFNMRLTAGTESGVLVGNTNYSSTSKDAGKNIVNSTAPTTISSAFTTDMRSPATSLSSTHNTLDITSASSTTIVNTIRNTNSLMTSSSIVSPIVTNSSIGVSASSTAPSTTFAAKKRKSETKTSFSLEDTNSSSFRDIMKDVSITLTPLTEYDKDAEKGSKKQKTEVSPPTHQSTDTVNQISREAIIISNSSSLNSHHTVNNNSSNTNNSNNNNNNNNNSSNNTSNVIRQVNNNDNNKVNTITATTSGNSHKSNGGNVVIAASVCGSTSIPASVPATASASVSATTTGSTNLTACASAKEREERYAAVNPPSSIIAASNCMANNTAITAVTNHNNNNAPSLYVSVPLSNANVPGINIPATNSMSAATAIPTSTATAADHSTSQSIIRTTTSQHQQQQQQPQSEQQQQIVTLVNNTTVSSSSSSSSSLLSSSSSTAINEQQTVAGFEAQTMHTTTGGSIMQSTTSALASSTSVTAPVPLPTAGGVIYHPSGKSPGSGTNANSNSFATNGASLIATTTETGNIKICYEKQPTTRLTAAAAAAAAAATAAATGNQMQEHESNNAARRSSRSRSGEKISLSTSGQQYQQQSKHPHHLHHHSHYQHPNSVHKSNSLRTIRKRNSISKSNASHNESPSTTTESIIEKTIKGSSTSSWLYRAEAKRNLTAPSSSIRTLSGSTTTTAYPLKPITTTTTTTINIISSASIIPSVDDQNIKKCCSDSPQRNTANKDCTDCSIASDNHDYNNSNNNNLIKNISSNHPNNSPQPDISFYKINKIKNINKNHNTITNTTTTITTAITYNSPISSKGNTVNKDNYINKSTSTSLSSINHRKDAGTSPELNSLNSTDDTSYVLEVNTAPTNEAINKKYLQSKTTLYCRQSQLRQASPERRINDIKNYKFRSSYAYSTTICTTNTNSAANNFSTSSTFASKPFTNTSTNNITDTRTTAINVTTSGICSTLRFISNTTIPTTNTTTTNINISASNCNNIISSTNNNTNIYYSNNNENDNTNNNNNNYNTNNDDDDDDDDDNVSYNKDVIEIIPLITHNTTCISSSPTCSLILCSTSNTNTNDIVNNTNSNTNYTLWSNDNNTNNQINKLQLSTNASNTTTTTTTTNITASDKLPILTILTMTTPTCYTTSNIKIPDSSVYTTPISSSFPSFSHTNASSVSNCNNTLNGSGGGLKFVYEAQTTTASSSAPVDINPNNIKESPPSSPNSEAGVVRKRGRKAKDPNATAVILPTGASTANAITTTTTTTPNTTNTTTSDIKDIKPFSIANNALTTNISSSTVSSLPVTSATHMLGNQINPNSSVAQKLSDQLNMEIQDHSIYTADAVTPQFVGVPFPGKLRNSMSTTSAAASTITAVAPTTTATTTTSNGPSPLASMFGSGLNGNLSIPQSLEQLLERQWEQGSQFLMEQAQHFDIASLLSCLHQLQAENNRLEEHVASLIARRDHLLAVNARLAIPLNTNSTQSQVITNRGVNNNAAIPTTQSVVTTTSLAPHSIATAVSLASAATSLSNCTARMADGIAVTAAATRLLPTNVIEGVNLEKNNSDCSQAATISTTAAVPVPVVGNHTLLGITHATRAVSHN